MVDGGDDIAMGGDGSSEIVVEQTRTSETRGEEYERVIGWRW